MLKKRLLRGGQGVLGAAGLLVIGMLVWVKLAIQFPAPAGSYAVGWVDLDLTDPARTEIFSGGGLPQKREILVTVYYPALPAHAARFSPYVSAASLHVLAEKYHLPEGLLHWVLPDSHAYASAAVAPAGAFPVLLFSPGWGANPHYYTVTLEDLASRGYSVAAIWHTYSCDLTLFPDGRVIPASQAGSDPDGYTTDESEITRVRNRVGDVWIADARFVLTYLSGAEVAQAPFAAGLDLSRVGMFGHSFGGTVALEWANQDHPLKAVADMDGSPAFGQPDLAARRALPALIMRSATPQLTEAELTQENLTRPQYAEAVAQNDRRYEAYIRTWQPGYLFNLAASAHMSYVSDLKLISPALPFLLGARAVGAISPQRAVTVYDNYLADFFDVYLKGKPAAWLTRVPPADVHLEVYSQ